MYIKLAHPELQQSVTPNLTVQSGPFDQQQRSRCRLGQYPTDDIAGVVKAVCSRFKVTEVEQNGVLQHLADSNEMNRCGLANAVTQYG